MTGALIVIGWSLLGIGCVLALFAFAVYFGMRSLAKAEQDGHELTAAGLRDGLKGGR